MNAWERILAVLEKRISPQNFDTWFRPTHLQAEQGNELLVQVPHPLFRAWIEEHYSQQLQQVISDLGLHPLLVRLYVLSEPPEAAPPPESHKGEGARQEAEPECVSFNPQYTFSTFVVGSSNQFAQAAALAVSEQPSKAYNPLYIYGGVGLGKTHLLHAIGHVIQAKSRRVRLTYMSSERFMNELINSIRYDRTPAFRERYRNIDVLLMDDVQFLAGKERTQEEFFHTFNALYDSQKQIVISSDCAPKQIPTLEERLHSRFEWGLIADIQAPDLETKVAILRKKAALENVLLPDDVALFIAGNIKSNIRELEGSLVRLIAFSSLTGFDLSLSLAQDVLRNIASEGKKSISIDRVKEVVAAHFNLQAADLKAKNNSQAIAEPRQIAMYLCKELTDSSLPRIGREFGGKHHTTVLHSIRKVQNLVRCDAAFQKLIHTLIDSLR
ncbi:MAG: chromosomal replication initiator protein DnaA [Acidobacteria bacterium]|nr:chromosomal replication initiator protein DnaA [Acidobacteriota bacterium]